MPELNCFSTEAQKRAKEGDCDVMSLAAMPVIIGISMVGVAILQEFSSSQLGTPAPAFPIVTGSIWSVTVQLWNWLSDSYDELDWFDAELHIVAEVVTALEPYGGVSVADVYGNELDVDNLPHPNAPDGGSDCVICIDQDYYDTSRGFQWIRTRIENILEEILEDV